MIMEVLKDEKVPHYTTIYRRIQSLDVQTNGGTVTVTGGKGTAIRFAVDSTGLKQHTRGELDTAKVEGKARFVKMHVLVDVDTKKILAVRVTDDRTGDSPMFIPLLDDALENCVRAADPASESGHANGSTKCSMYGDGAYASRDNLKACKERNVTPLIKLKVMLHPKRKRCRRRVGARRFGTSLVGSDPNRVKWLPDEEKKDNQKEWKARVEYGKRWIVEIVFSAFKRMFGEHLYSLKWKNMIQEVNLKVSTYNKLIDMGAGVVVESDRANPVQVLGDRVELCNKLVWKGVLGQQ